MDDLNQSAELLCTMSPRIKHKLKPGQKQFRRVAGASILALKKNIRRSSLHDKSIQTIDNNDLNVESTSSTESCDSEKWKINILNKSPIVISDSDSDFESEITDKYEQDQDAINLQNCSLPSDKVNDIERWIEKVNAANENEDTTDTTAYTEFSTICGSETGENFLPKEKGPVVNSTFITKDCKRFDEFFQPKNIDPNVVNSCLENDDNEDVIVSSKKLIIEDSFESQNESLTTRVNKLLSSNDSQVNDEKNTFKTPPKTPVGEGEDLEVMLDKLYGRSWRDKQELILPKTEPRHNTAKVIATHMYSERKPREVETLKPNNLLQKLQNVRLETKEKSSLYTKLKVLCDSDTSSENSPVQIYPKTRLNFDDSNDELTNDPKISKYFRTKRGLETDIEKFDSSKENYDISDLEQSSEEVIRKEVNNIKDLPNKNKTKGKHSTRRKNTTSNKENIPNKIHAQPKSININGQSQSSSTSNSDDETSRIKFVTKRRVDKPIIANRISISSDDEWNQEISKIHRKSQLCNGTYSFLASLSGNIPISKCDMSARIYRNNFKTFKDQLLSKLFKMYNEQIFENALAPDMLFEWNDRMTGTAGYCYCKKITRKSGQVERSARVVLSTKVIDSAQRMRDTLIHELCHAATWIVNCVSDGHGPYWKTWAYKAMKCFPELPPIKRCHDYVINTKYTYKCVGCGYSVGRHTKSLDVERKRCGYCHGKFEVLINKTTKKGETKLVPATPKKEATGFALFVKQNYGIHKTPNLKHGDVMKLLGQKFQKMKVNQT